MELAKIVVREPGAQSVPAYRKRVWRLAITYLLMFMASLAGIFLLAWRSRFLVTITQRTNVETLVLGFFLVLFAYVAFLSAPGAFGALRIVYYALRGDEKRKQAGLGESKEEEHPVAALSSIVERKGAVGKPFTLKVADRAGRIARLHIDGARVTLEALRRRGSNNLLAFFTEQVNERLRKRGDKHRIEVVEWKKIDDEATEEFLAHVEFARNLEQKLGGDPLWPRVFLTDEDCDHLERRFAELCPSLRDEAFLPHWEYRGEHKLPIIPEPLGLISLQRSERRVDPEASMMAAAVIVLAAVSILTYLIMVPPWVPGP